MGSRGLRWCAALTICVAAAAVFGAPGGFRSEPHMSIQASPRPAAPRPLAPGHTQKRASARRAESIPSAHVPLRRAPLARYWRNLERASLPPAIAGRLSPGSLPPNVSAPARSPLVRSTGEGDCAGTGDNPVAPFPNQPPNDNFSSAQRLAGDSGSVTGTLVDATVENGSTTARNETVDFTDSSGNTVRSVDRDGWGGNPTRSVWYCFTAPSDGDYFFSTKGSPPPYVGPSSYSCSSCLPASAAPPVISIYEGDDWSSLTFGGDFVPDDRYFDPINVEPDSQANVKDPSTGEWSTTAGIYAHSGQTYWITVQNEPGYVPDSGAFVLGWAPHTPVPPPLPPDRSTYGKVTVVNDTHDEVRSYSANCVNNGFGFLGCPLSQPTCAAVTTCVYDESQLGGNVWPIFSTSSINNVGIETWDAVNSDGSVTNGVRATYRAPQLWTADVTRDYGSGPSECWGPNTAKFFGNVFFFGIIPNACLTYGVNDPPVTIHFTEHSEPTSVPLVLKNETAETITIDAACTQGASCTYPAGTSCAPHTTCTYDSHIVTAGFSFSPAPPYGSFWTGAYSNGTFTADVVDGAPPTPPDTGGGGPPPPPPGPPSFALSLDSQQVDAGGLVAMTLTLSHVLPDAFVVALPDGFSYVPGSASGTLSVDPGIGGQTLAWSDVGDLVTRNGTLPPPDPLTVRFQVRAPAVSGSYTFQAWATRTNPDLYAESTVQVTTPLILGAVADAPSAASGGIDGYTLTLDNTRAQPLTIDSIGTTLALGFVYTASSTTGVTTEEPGSSGDGVTTAQTLAWAGPFTVPSERALTLHFNVAVQADDGDYGTTFHVNSVTPVVPATVKVNVQRVPLIVIPGITGSYLADSSGSEAWPREESLLTSFSDSFLDAIAFDPQGQPLNSVGVDRSRGANGMIERYALCNNIPVPGTLGGWFPWVDIKHVCFHKVDVYDATLAFLRDHGYQDAAGPSQTLFPWGYDWRKSAAQNAGDLLAYIDQILATTKAGKAAGQVDILAHSQGGLVVEAALRSAQDIGSSGRGKIRRVVTLGTPYLGTPKFLDVLQFGQPCFHSIGPLCIANRDEVQKLVQDFPGALELLPSSAYYAVEPKSPITIHNDQARVYAAYEEPDVLALLARQGRNMPLINQARGWHAESEPWSSVDPKVKLLRVVGHGLGTIGQIRWNRVKTCRPGFRSPSPICSWTDSTDEIRVDGDGTVVLQSAQEASCAKGVDLTGDPSRSFVRSVRDTHEALAQDAAPLGDALAFLRSSSPAGAHPCSGPRSVRRSYTSADGATDGFAGVDVIATGPIAGNIVDDQGNVTGMLNPDLGISTEQIPDSSFDEGIGSSSYFVADAGTYSGTWDATGSGDVSFKVRTYAGGDVAGMSTTPAIHVAAGAVLSLAYGQPSPLSVLQLTVDDNADGIPDRSIPFGPALSGASADDSIPPVSSVSVVRYQDAHKQWLARVTVNVTDLGGSGVARTEYFVNATGQSGTYTQPLVLPAKGEIYVRSTDNAGNVEDYVIGVLDDHPSLRELVTDYVVPRFNSTGYLDYAGDVDWWGVRVQQAGRYKIQLDGLTYDANVALYDAGGNEVASTTRPAKKSEQIMTSLGVGTYYIEIDGAQGAWDDTHAYHLSVEPLGG